MPKSDRYAGLFFVALSVYVCWEATNIGVGGLRHPSPGLLAFAASVAMGFLGLFVSIRSFLVRQDPAAVAGKKGGARVATIVAVSISLFVYAELVSWLGFSVPTFLFVFFLLQVGVHERWWMSAMKSVLVTVAMYLVFVTWLGIMLPAPFWEQ